MNFDAALPRAGTQHYPPLIEVNYCAHVLAVDTLERLGSVIGQRPLLLPVAHRALELLAHDGEALLLGREIAQPRRQLLGCKGLDQVVVGPAVQALDALDGWQTLEVETPTDSR